MTREVGAHAAGCIRLVDPRDFACPAARDDTDGRLNVRTDIDRRGSELGRAADNLGVEIR